MNLKLKNLMAGNLGWYVMWNSIADTHIALYRLEN